MRRSKSCSAWHGMGNELWAVTVPAILSLWSVGKVLTCIWLKYWIKRGNSWALLVNSCNKERSVLAYAEWFWDKSCNSLGVGCIFLRNRASCSGARGRLSLWVFHTFMSMYWNQMQWGKRKNFLPLSQNCCNKLLFKSMCTSQDSAFALLICLLVLIFAHL